jgi:putative secretion ATPase (PEP-CTERM system associated)
MYERHFGLSAKPFQLNPDPDFFFGSRGHKRAMAYLEYGLHQGEGFIVITGEVGAGKTTLLRGLLRRIPADTIEPVQIVSTQVDSDDLLRLVATAFGLPAGGEDKATLLTRLQQHLEALHNDGRRALLIVDEAQNLSARAVEELRMLSNFQIGSRSLVQSFLVGQPEFREIMQRPEMRQLKQRVIASYHLGPLDAEETRHYIEHRLRHVGWSDRPGFEPSAFGAIHSATEGIPRRINTLCDRLLLAAFLGEKTLISAEDVSTVAQEQAKELGGEDAASEESSQSRDFSSTNDRAHPPADGPSEAARRAVRAAAQIGPTGPVADRILQLEERIEMLEASNAMMFNLMRKVLRVMRQPQGIASATADRQDRSQPDGHSNGNANPSASTQPNAAVKPSDESTTRDATAQADHGGRPSA